jgi:hypothetical protein
VFVSLPFGISIVIWVSFMPSWYFVAILVYVFHFGSFYQEKSGNPAFDVSLPAQKFYLNLLVCHLNIRVQTDFLPPINGMQNIARKMYSLISVIVS